MSMKVIHLPWPRLDGPWRANPYGTKLVPARNGKGFEDLRLFDVQSLAFYGSFDDPNFKTAFRHTLSWIYRQHRNLEYFGIDRFPFMDEVLQEARAHGEKPLLHEGSYPDVLGFIRHLVSYGNGYLKLLQDAGLSWSPNGKYIVGIFPLSSEDLDDEVLRKTLSELMLLTSTTPVRPIFLLENPRRMPADVQNALSWQGFFGKDQMGYGRERYALEPLPGMRSRIPIGMAFDRTKEQLRILNGLNYEPTAEHIEEKQARADDAADYRRFLEGLTDGS